MKEYLKELEPVLPENFEDMFSGEKCMFCKENENDKDGYAFSDIVHAKEGGFKGSVFGIKNNVKSGALLPLKIPCCKDCKRKINAITYWPVAIKSAFGAAALILVYTKTVREALMSAARVLPLIVFITICALGAVVGSTVKKALIKKYAENTYLNIFDIESMKKMKKLGWKELYENKGCSKMAFSDMEKEEK